MTNWAEVVVEKPWGYEYEIFDNGIVSVWCLQIKAGCQTSMHAHPNKLTGIIMARGLAELTFMDNPPQTLRPLDKRVIHHHVFHQTRAIEDTLVLETETPPNKLDLTRLEDQYGREGEPYEGIDKMQERTAPMLSMGDQWRLGLCHVRVQKIDRDYIPGAVHVFLTGGLIGKKGQPVSIPGHSVWSNNLDRLLKISDIIEGTEVMSVW